MGKSGATWPKGQKPPVQKPKGAIHKKTKAIRAMGLQNWAQLEGWAENEGIRTAIAKLEKLRGVSYINAYAKLLEYIKPKLSRVDYKDDTGDNIQFDFQKLPLELRTQLLEHLRNDKGTAEQNT